MKKIIALLMMVALVLSLTVVSVAALPSPTAVEYYYFTAYAVPEELGDATVDVDRVLVGSDDLVTFTATEENGGKFIKWELHCEYDIIEGDMTTPVLVVRPKSDIEAVAFFEATPEEPTKGTEATEAPTVPEKDPTQKNDSPTSPKTGDMSIMLAVVMLMAVGISVIAVRKIKG